MPCANDKNSRIISVGNLFCLGLFDFHSLCYLTLSGHILCLKLKTRHHKFKKGDGLSIPIYLVPVASHFQLHNKRSFYLGRTLKNNNNNNNSTIYHPNKPPLFSLQQCL